MKHSLVAALSALLLSAGLAWADDAAPATKQITGTITDVVAGANIITVAPAGDLGGSKGIGIQEQNPPPKKGGDIIPPPKGGETPIQDQGQVPPPKKGSKDLIDQSPGQVPPKKGGDIIPPPKGGETPIQDQGQVPPPKKGSKDLADPSQVIDQSQVPPPKKGTKDVTDPAQVIDQSQVPPKKGSKDLIEPSQDIDQGQVPPKKGSKSLGDAGISLLCDATTSIKSGDKVVGFDALQIGQHVQVTFAPLTSLVEPAVVPGKTDQTPPSKDEPVPGKTDQTPPSKADPVPPSKTEQTPPSKTDQVPPSKDEPVPGKTDQTPPAKKDGKAGPGKVQFHALSIIIIPQEPIQTQKAGKQEPIPQKNGKQEPQIQIQQQAPVPAK